MSSKNKGNNGNNENTTVLTSSMGEFSGISFNTDAILSKYAVTTLDGNGQEIVSYSMTVNGIGEHVGESWQITDRNAIESIEGLRNTQALDKWLSYRQGAYLMQLVDSSFMKDNEIKSVAKLADMIDLGVETSTSNALESVSRKLGVTFDDSGNLHLADGLPLLSFWTYSNIISLVVESDDGYDRSHLVDFIQKCNVTPLMSQKRVKELFKDYKAGKIGGTMVLPDKLADKVKKEEENRQKAEDEKKRADAIKNSASAYTASRMESAKNFMERKAVVLDMIQGLFDAIASISEDKANEVNDYFDALQAWANDVEESTEESAE